MDYVINIDVGTGSGRAILFTLDGTQTAAAGREWSPNIDPRYPGAQDFDTDRAWALLSACVREVIESLGPGDSIAAVSATAMREGMVLYDDRGEVIWACPNVDGRSRDQAATMIHQGLADRVYDVGGDWLSIIAPARFRWIRQMAPEIYRRIAHVTMLSDWVLYRLGGQLVTDPSIGSSSGVFDLRTRAWATELIAEIELPPAIYPPVVESGTVVAAVTARAARDTGLTVGTPVVTGGADTQLALVGCGAVTPGAYALCGGTFWQTAYVSNAPLVDPERRLRTLCHAVPGQWMTEGIGFFHGFTMRWFRDGFCEAERAEARQRGVDPYVVMEERAAALPPGSNGVQGLFSNVMNAKAWRHAPPSLVGFDLLRPEATGKAACIRAIEENAAYVARAHLAILTELSGVAPTELTMTGGSSKGGLWPRIVADVTGVPVRIPVVKETTSLGGAIAAWIGVGAYSSWRDGVERTVRWDRTVTPHPANVAAYHESFATWHRAYSTVMTLAEDGILPPMWQAPGLERAGRRLQQSHA